MTMPAPNDHPLLTAARLWFDAGYCVIPSHEDGGKRPMGRWKSYQQTRMDWAELESMLTTGKYTGIGVITGHASGDVEMVEIEGPMAEAVTRLNAVIAASATFAEIGLDDLLRRVARGCVERSAGDGLHLFIRVTDGPAKPNTKLAMGADGQVIAETRGEGGFVIVAPTPGRKGHPEGATYAFLPGSSPAKTVEVTAEERDLLHELFRQALDESPVLEVVAPRALEPFTGTSSLDAFRATSWHAILTPLGWTWDHRDDTRDYWVRPGKSAADGISASTIEDGPMVCFSTNAGLPTDVGMSKGQVYAHLHHGGDMSAASRALSDQGFGDRLGIPPLASWEPTVATSEPTHGISTPEDTDWYALAVQRRYSELKVTEDARQMLAAEKAGAAPDLAGISLADFLAEPDAPVRYRVEGLWPAEGRVLLAAAAKSGKTTMVAANLLPSLVDGREFLGRYPASTVDGNVVLLNMEVGENTLRRWMRDSGIENAGKVQVANLRGKASALTLNTEAGRSRLAEWLRAAEAEVVILDPLAPVLASLGLDENSNADVAQFFSWWSEALTLAGVRDDVVVHHAGHAGQRSRGASRLLDEPDAVWTLTREMEEGGEFSPLEPTRYLSAYGRDVELQPEALAFELSTRRLVLTGQNRAEIKGERLDQKIRAVMAKGVPMTRTAIKDAAVALGASNNPAWDRVQELIADGTLQAVGKGKEYVWADAVEVVP